MAGSRTAACRCLHVLQNNGLQAQPLFVTPTRAESSEGCQGNVTSCSLRTIHLARHRMQVKTRRGEHICRRETGIDPDAELPDGRQESFTKAGSPAELAKCTLRCRFCTLWPEIVTPDHDPVHRRTGKTAQTDGSVLSRARGVVNSSSASPKRKDSLRKPDEMGDEHGRVGGTGKQTR